MMDYQSGVSFRRALEDRLANQSAQTQMPLVRLRKMVAFDRFLARLVQTEPDRWLLKGGLVLQLRLSYHARTTKDMDLLSLAPREAIQQILTHTALLDLHDWFSFTVRPDSAALPGVAHGGQRFFVSAQVAGRSRASTLTWAAAIRWSSRPRCWRRRRYWPLQASLLLGSHAIR
jgi:hypothetical protein